MDICVLVSVSTCSEQWQWIDHDVIVNVKVGVNCLSGL